MRIILLGPPGCGKGTQAKLLSAGHGMTHISTGDLFREAIAVGTPMGIEAKRFMDDGRLVPDKIVNGLVAEVFGRKEKPSSFLMDGYPRTTDQAQVFGRILAEANLPLDAVVLLDVPDGDIEQRIVGRLTCSNCKVTFHLTNHPPRVAGVCDVCGSKLTQRKDDNPETVRERLKEYHAQTAALVPHYRELGLLREVNGSGDIQEVYQRILDGLHLCGRD
jgi:adenylate kinase